MNKQALSNMDQFYGTEGYHRFSPLFPNLVLTDGAKFLCDNADCYWLMDVIGSHQPTAQKDESLRDMQFWSLRPYPPMEKYAPMTVGHVLQVTGKIPQPRLCFKTQGGILEHMKCTEGHPACAVVCERDTDDTAIVQDIPFTDFPFDAMPEVKLYVAPSQMANGALVYVVLLPSEY